MDLRESAAGGFAVLASLKIAGTIVARLSAIALALLLTPSDFGIFAIATFFVGLLILLADFGLGTELVRRPASPPGTLETAFTIRLVLAVIIVALTPILGYAMGMAYQDMRLASLIPISSIPILLFVFTFPSRTLALHRLQYGRASIPDHLGKMAAPILAIALALLGLGYWSFPFSMIAGATLAVVLALIAVPWRPVIRYDRRVAREVATLGKFIMITSLARTIAGSVDTAYLGFFAGAEMTGFYAVASSWGIYMTSNLSSLLSGVTYPIFVQVQDAKERIARGLQEVVRYYGYLATYLSAGVFILAEPFVVSILGPNWIPTIVPMRVLSVSGFLIGLATIGYDALTAVGMPKLVSRVSVTQTVFLVVILPPIISFQGLFGASVVVTLGAAISSLLSFRAVRSVFAIPLRPTFRQVFVSWSAAFLTWPFVYVAATVLGHGIFQFAILFFLYTLLYLGILHGATGGAAVRDGIRVLRMVMRRGKGLDRRT